MSQVRSDSYARKHYEREITDNLEHLLAVLPPPIAEAVVVAQRETSHGALIEIVLDLGRPPEARFQEDEVYLSEIDVTREDIRFAAERVGRFGDDNRAGDIVGLTCRIGRAVYGTIAIISDLIESGESILLLGRPGVGKTTMLRESARVLADDLH